MCSWGVCTLFDMLLKHYEGNLMTLLENKKKRDAKMKKRKWKSKEYFVYRKATLCP